MILIMCTRKVNLEKWTTRYSIKILLEYHLEKKGKNKN